MKKIIGLLLFIVLGAVGVLATVDLEAYVSPRKNKTSLPGTSTQQEMLKVGRAAEKVQEETGQVVLSQEIEVNGEADTAGKQRLHEIEDLGKGDQPPKIISEEGGSLLVTSHWDPVQVKEQPHTLFDSAAGDSLLSPSVKESGQSASGSVMDGQKQADWIQMFQVKQKQLPFSVLLETYNEQERAHKAIQLYHARGVSAYWVKVDLGRKGIKYRLFTGAFATAAEARSYTAKHKLSDKLVKKTRYSSLVGIYKDKKKACGLADACRNNQWVPYLLDTDKGDYYLYVGAFYTRAGATQQCREMQKAGLPCTPGVRTTKE